MLCALRWARLLISPHVLCNCEAMHTEMVFQRRPRKDKKVDILAIVNFTATLLLYQSTPLDLPHSLKNHSCKAQSSKLLLTRVLQVVTSCKRNDITCVPRRAQSFKFYSATTDCAPFRSIAPLDSGTNELGAAKKKRAKKK